LSMSTSLMTVAYSSTIGDSMMTVSYSTLVHGDFVVLSIQ
jgi:hypothetical protein